MPPFVTDLNHIALTIALIHAANASIASGVTTSNEVAARERAGPADRRKYGAT